MMKKTMKIAVEGCAHGELEKIYETIQCIEQKENIKVDLLLCCGDFQSTRNLADLKTMAVPEKYSDICTFYKYYSGELVAPMLTIFVGGNHEASNYLQELPYGGWVAPNIYYLGYAGVVRVNGVRIAGMSGIYKGFNFLRGHFECTPYTDKTMRSVYHQRQLELFRLRQLTGEIDIFMSHDWPRGIEQFGNTAQLLRFKPHFAEDIERNQLGSKPCEELLHALQPKYWFAAHLHCKFAAVVAHHNNDIDYDDDDDGGGVENNSDKTENSNDMMNDKEQSKSSLPRLTKFLALDKCLPKRRFLQVLDIDTNVDAETATELQFEYDAEWLAILQNTNHLLSIRDTTCYMPGESSTERYIFTPTPEELQNVRLKFADNLKVPKNFCRTVESYNPETNDLTRMVITQPKPQINPQSKEFCDKLGVDDPISLILMMQGKSVQTADIIEDDAPTDTSTLYDTDTSFNDTAASFTDTNAADTSICSASSSNENILKRKSLNLPTPNTSMQAQLPSTELSGGTEQLNIGDDSDDNVEDEDCDADEFKNEDLMDIDETARNSITELIAEKAQKIEESAILSLNEIHKPLAAAAKERKFKRRNETIYNIKDDDQA